MTDHIAKYRAYVENIGFVGAHGSLLMASKLVRDTIRLSARAGKHGWVEDDTGEIRYETGRPEEF